MSDQKTATHYRWDELERDRPLALLSRRRIIGEKMMISEIVLEKGCDVPSHQHANEQFTIVLEGCLRFGIGEPGSPEHRFVDVRAGEVLHLPPNVFHSACVIEDSRVLDVFSPPSQKTGVDRG
jgi:quercetin dioxygenase-like cupin family protein